MGPNKNMLLQLLSQGFPIILRRNILCPLVFELGQPLNLGLQSDECRQGSWHDTPWEQGRHCSQPALGRGSPRRLTHRWSWRKPGTRDLNLPTSLLSPLPPAAKPLAPLPQPHHTWCWVEEGAHTREQPLHRVPTPPTSFGSQLFTNSGFSLWRKLGAAGPRSERRKKGRSHSHPQSGWDPVFIRVGTARDIPSAMSLEKWLPLGHQLMCWQGQPWAQRYFWVITIIPWHFQKWKN